MEEITLLRKEIKTMIDSADEKTIRIMYAMLEASSDDDWWNELNDKEKKEIEEAMNESVNEENQIPFATFQSEFNVWRKELLSSKEQNKK